MKLLSDRTRWFYVNLNHRAGRLRSAVCGVVLSLLSVVPAVTLAQTDDAAAKAESSWQLGLKSEAGSAADTQPESKPADGSLNSTAQVEEQAAAVITAAESDTQEAGLQQINAELEGLETEFVADDLTSEVEDSAAKISESEAPENTVSAGQAQAERQVQDETAESVAQNRINSTPIIDLSPEFRQSLERQFQRIREIEEEEDAFSENLGEAYLGYGQLLAQAGRLDEARDNYVKALHLSKINNGVYAIEQRPVLRALFEMHQAEGSVQDMEASLEQIIWLEKKHPSARDSYSYDLVVALGRAYIDAYYANPRATELTIMNVDKGLRYMRYAINRYGDLPLRQRLLPFGELALLNHIKSKLSNDIGRASFSSQQRPGLERQPITPISTNHLSNATIYLNRYFNKAQREGSIEHQVLALRDLGDLYLLFNRGKEAAVFYNRAWLIAGELDADHELVRSFDEPMKIPNFNYAVFERNFELSGKPFVRVPLNFNLDEYGRVDKVNTASDAPGPYPTLIPRAKRLAKRLVFRPIVENGKIIAADNVDYDVLVFLRKREQQEIATAEDS